MGLISGSEVIMRLIAVVHIETAMNGRNATAVSAGGRVYRREYALLATHNRYAALKNNFVETKNSFVETA
jgi:hypothetical protein